VKQEDEMKRARWIIKCAEQWVVNPSGELTPDFLKAASFDPKLMAEAIASRLPDAIVVKDPR